MSRKIFQLCVLLMLLFPVLLGGCIGGTSPQSAYYVFSTSQDQLQAPSPLKEHDLGVGPIRLPGFLKRPQIVTRQEQNLLTVNEFHRWGDSLEDQITGVLVDNLSALLNTSNVSSYPWEKPFSPTLQLFVDFRRFDGEINDSVHLEAVWWIVDTQDDKRLITKRSSMVEQIHGEGYKPYVIALNTALEKLCLEIVKGVIESMP